MEDKTPKPAKPDREQRDEGDYKSPFPNRFEVFPENLKKILIDLETNYKVIKRDPSGIALNLKIFETIESNIYSNYNETEIEFLKLIFSTLLKLKFHWLNYPGILNHYRYFFHSKDSDTFISTGEDLSHEDKIKDKKGLSLLEGPNLGSPSVKRSEFDNLSDIPFENIPELIQKRKDDFGIWISKKALRHFETLSYRFGVNDDLFNKIETYFSTQFNLEYGKRSWATPITNDKRDELGLCFGVQFTKKGYLRINLSKKKKDWESFIQQFFTLFKKFLSDEEIIELLEQLVLERFKKPAIYVHEARNIGPKEVVDEKFKGVKVRVNEIHWFGDKRWIARIDYSDPSHPHIEGEGPQPQVGNFLNLFDGTPEFVSNLTEVRELAYRNYALMGENHKGIGNLSQLLLENDKKISAAEKNFAGQHQDILGELTKLDVLQDIRSINLENRIGNLGNNLNHSFKQGVGVLHKMNQNVGLINNSLGHLYDFVDSGFKEIEENMIDQLDPVIDSLSINSQKHDETHQKLDTLQKNIEDQFKSLKSDLEEHIKNELTTFRKGFVNNLYLVLKAIHNLPGITTKEIITQLQKKLKVTESTIYRYLRELKFHDLITKVENCIGPGRPSRSYFISKKTREFLAKFKSKKEVKES